MYVNRPLKNRPQAGAIAERCRFFQQLIDQERDAREKEAKRPKARPRLVKSRRTQPRTMSEPVPPKTRTVPSLPDRIWWSVFAFLDYKQQCKAEQICQRWMRIIRQKHSREIKELIVELSGSNKCNVFQQTSFQRLSVICPKTALDHLSGVIRRCSQHLERLTCDLSLFSLVSKLNFEAQEDQKYFNGVESLWLVVTRCSDEMLADFETVEAYLFNSLANMTVQVHVCQESAANVSRLINRFVKLFPPLEIDLEIHASTNYKLNLQLDHFFNLRLKKLKLICSALDTAMLNLPMISKTITDSKITFQSISFREWYMTFDGETPISTTPLSLLRFNSCTMKKSNEFVQAIFVTWNQKRKRVRKTSVPAQREAPSEKPVKAVSTVKRKPSFIKKLEMAGSCQFVDLNFMPHNAHEVVRSQITNRCPNLNVDTSDIYIQ